MAGWIFRPGDSGGDSEVSTLPLLQPGELYDEENAEDEDSRRGLGPPSGEQLDRAVGDEAEGDAVGDGEGQRHGERGDDGRRVFGHVLPVDLGKALRHD